ncbi:MAG: hypothetical protein Q8M29_18165 [Bacteroidota bacterium]|nr:hypothetical protein [Bacteroidota bacterium]
MKPLKKIVLLFLFISALAGCTKDTGLPGGPGSVSESDVPEAIQQAIIQFDQEEDCATANVKEYIFQAQRVYTFDPGICGADMTTRVATGNNGTLGHLGGIAGNLTINGENFSSAVYVRTIWENQ